MYRRGWTVSWLVSLLLIGLAAGCSDDAKNPIGSDTQNGNPILDEPLGGLTNENEMPAFGDQDLALSATAEAPFDDSMAHDPNVTVWQLSASTKYYAVTMLWGVLDGDPSVRTSDIPSDAPVTEWDGSASVTVGAILTRSTIAFERDDAILPRLDRRMVEWTSHTTVSFDGIRLIVMRPAMDTTGDESFTVKAGTHEWSFPIEDLAEMNNIYAIDETNKFMIRSFEISPASCARGFLGGAWLPPETDRELGSFRGRWVSANGNLAGFVRGHFGLSASGNRVFFGKCIDLNGNFKAFVRGTYGQDGLEMGQMGMDSRFRHYGWFRGEWLNENEAVTGRVRGNWRSILDGSEGFFEGIWTDGCDRP